MYILRDGTTVTADQIKQAFADGKAILIHSRGDSATVTSLSFDGAHFDTRGQCASMWEEAWTQEPETIQQALNAAYSKV